MRINSYLKLVVLLGLTLLEFSSLAVPTSVNGILFKQDQTYFLKNIQTQKSYTLVPTNTKTFLTLNKLSAGDQIFGIADFDQGILKLNSIDYVGLQKVLGKWYSSSLNIFFKNFTEVTMIALQQQAGSKLKTIVTQYKYSITPSSSNEWYIFLSADTGYTALATIILHETTQTLILKYYDADTGNLSAYYELSKHKP